MSLTDVTSTFPELTGQALAAVKHRGTHVQIIAGAGSGKTEVVAQRIVRLLAENVPPRSIVAFTFGKKAAAELKDRVARRLEAVLGPGALGQLNGLQIGTIHSYCLQMLRRHAPAYSAYDTMDDAQLAVFLAQLADTLQLKQFDPRGKDRVYAGIKAFRFNVDVVENELLDPSVIPGAFGAALRQYYQELESHRWLPYGQQIVKAVQFLTGNKAEMERRLDLRHLIVDEYQDINPAQERLISLLTGANTHLCVVGDDQQAIYQWRGTDVNNIISFTDRYQPSATFNITVNRRSRGPLVDVANQIAATIPVRIPKTMGYHRPSSGTAPEAVLWGAPTEAKEAEQIATLIGDLRQSGARYRDIAILVRGKAALPTLAERLMAAGVPVQLAGYTHLFEQPEGVALGQTICWLTDLDWRQTYGPSQPITEDSLLDGLQRGFNLDQTAGARLRQHLRDWKGMVGQEERPSDLVTRYYEFIREFGGQTLQTLPVSKLGVLAKFSALLADYESVQQRSKPDPNMPGEQLGGRDRGQWYYRSLGLYIINYAQGAYEGFDGEPDYDLDAVNLITIHSAKGLEWPAVFVASVTNKRFSPFSETAGQNKPAWLIPDNILAQAVKARYEGSDTDGRRLLYVAMTRARDWLSVSYHNYDRGNHDVGISAYVLDLDRLGLGCSPSKIRIPTIDSRTDDDETPIALSFSDLSQFIQCGWAYRLRTRLGFQIRLATELGYGRAVHTIMRAIAEITKREGSPPSDIRIQSLVDKYFYLPTASKTEHRQLKKAARRIVLEYVEQHQQDLHRTWQTERPFELHLAGVTITGQADVIMDGEENTPGALAVVDYKTSVDPDIWDYDLQLQIYTAAGMREGLDMRAAYVHDLKRDIRHTVSTDHAQIVAAQATATAAAQQIREREFLPKPEATRCQQCEVRRICNHAAHE